MQTDHPDVIQERIRELDAKRSTISSLDEILAMINSITDECFQVKKVIGSALEESLCLFCEQIFADSNTSSGVTQLLRKINLVRISSDCSRIIRELARKRMAAIKNNSLNESNNLPEETTTPPTVDKNIGAIIVKANPKTQNRLEKFETFVLENLPPYYGLMDKSQFIAKVMRICHINEQEKPLLCEAISNLIKIGSIVVEGKRIRSVRHNEVIDTTSSTRSETTVIKTLDQLENWNTDDDSTEDIVYSPEPFSTPLSLLPPSTDQEKLTKLQKENTKLWELLKINEEKITQLTQELATISDEKAQIAECLELANKKLGKESARVVSQAIKWQKDTQEIKSLTARIANKDATIQRLQRELSTSSTNMTTLAILLQIAQSANSSTLAEKQSLLDQLKIANDNQQKLLNQLNKLGKNPHVKACVVGNNGGALITIIETSKTGLPTKKEIVISTALLQ